MRSKSILEQGRNCWRICHASRVAFLIDSASYFEAFVAAAENARESLFILGWDIYSRVPLLRGGRARPRLTCELKGFLNTLVARRPKLHIYILIWDFAMIYALDRELLPLTKFDSTHPRIKFRLDDRHPIGGSHHQKIIVVDDAVAFVGGIDLTRGRWDTPEHLADNPLRIDPSGRSYPPRHDIQMAVDGEAAASLGELARERWHRATGEILGGPPASGDPWPHELVPDLTNVDVAIARTRPAYEEQAEEVREIETLYLDAISRAHRLIYIENQYFTSVRLAEALSAQLEKDDAPEVVLILPAQTAGWLEEGTMGLLRSRRLKELRTADSHGSLRIYYPTRAGLGAQGIYVHSKLVIIDDCFVCVGSANLNNRSMGLDSECNLAVETVSRHDTISAIARFRNRLLAEHLGVPLTEIERGLKETGSLLSVLDERRTGARRLEALNVEIPEWLDHSLPDSTLLDPERPVEPEKLIRELAIDLEGESSFDSIRSWIGLIVVTALLFSLAAAWRWTSLNQWLDVDAIFAWIESLKGNPLIALPVVAVYVVGSLIIFPVTVLIAATAFAFGPVLGFVYALLGCLAGATATYVMGKFLGRRGLQPAQHAWLEKWSHRVRERGIIAVTAMRLVPIGPFTVVNMAAGASHIPFRDFIVGTTFGMVPGILALTVFEHQFENAVRSPGLQSFVILAVVSAVILAAVLTVHHWIRKK